MSVAASRAWYSAGFMRVAVAPVVVALVLLVGCDDGEPPADRTAYLRAQRAYAAGNLEEAKELIGALVVTDPQFLQARLLLGRAALLAGSVAEAEATLRELVTEAPHYRDARLWWVRTLIALGQHPAARAELDSLLLWYPDDPRLLLLLGELADAGGRTEEVVAAYARAATFADDLARGALTVARSYYTDGDLDRARAALSEAQRLATPDGVLREAIVRLKAVVDRPGRAAR